MTDIERLRQLTALNDLDAARALLRHAQRANDMALTKEVLPAALTRDPALYREALQPLVVGGHIEAQIQSRNGDWPYQGGMRTNGGNHLWFDTRLPNLLTAARGDIDGMTVGDVRAPVEWAYWKTYALNCCVVASLLEATVAHLGSATPEARAWADAYKAWALEVPQPKGRSAGDFDEWKAKRPRGECPFPYWVWQVVEPSWSGHSARFISRITLNCLPGACDCLAERAGGMRATTAEIYHARFMQHGREALLRLLFVTPDEE